MIIPIRCFTCNRVLASKYESYLEYVNNKKSKNDDEELLTTKTITDLLNSNKREKIIADRDELEDRERRGSGADRLNSRGRDAFKRLQEEEKIRARAKKLLPKVNKELVASLKQWEERYGSPLTYDGENYHSRMLRQRKEYADRKEEEKLRKEKERAEKKKASQAKKSENKFTTSHNKSRHGASSKRRASNAVLSQKNGKH